VDKSNENEIVSEESSATDLQVEKISNLKIFKDSMKLALRVALPIAMMPIITTSLHALGVTDYTEPFIANLINPKPIVHEVPINDENITKEQLLKIVENKDWSSDIKSIVDSYIMSLPSDQNFFILKENLLDMEIINKHMGKYKIGRFDGLSSNIYFQDKNISKDVLYHELVHATTILNKKDDNYYYYIDCKQKYCTKLLSQSLCTSY
jgi:hypothetical protein